MRHLVRWVLPACAVAVLTACGGSDDKDPTTPPPTPQVGSVAGVVRDQTNAGVPGATISLTAAGQTARSQTTGNDGAYLFTSVPVGTWTATVTAPTGFSTTATTTRSVTVSAGGTATVEAFALSRNAPPGPAPTSADVSITGSSFSPATVTIARGGSVTWTNRDPIAHNAVNTGSSPFNSGTLNQNQTFRFTFNTAGTFNYVCTFHAGMNGTVIVQ